MSEPTTVPQNSDSGLYLLLVAAYGRCTCGHGALCSEEPATDERMHCRLCSMLDPEWPCPTLDDDADYPDPDKVFIAVPGGAA